MPVSHVMFPVMIMAKDRYMVLPCRRSIAASVRRDRAFAPALALASRKASILALDTASRPTEPADFSALAQACPANTTARQMSRFVKQHVPDATLASGIAGDRRQGGKHRIVEPRVSCFPL